MYAYFSSRDGRQLGPEELHDIALVEGMLSWEASLTGPSPAFVSTLTELSPENTHIFKMPDQGSIEFVVLSALKRSLSGGYYPSLWGRVRKSPALVWTPIDLRICADPTQYSR